MLKLSVLEEKLNGVAVILTGRDADFEILTEGSVKNIEPGQTVLTSDGIVSRDKFQVEVNSLIAVLEHENQQICLFKKRGLLNFHKEILVAYKPVAVLLKDGKMAKGDILHRQLFKPIEKPLLEFSSMEDIVKEKAMVKMVFK